MKWRFAIPAAAALLALAAWQVLTWPDVVRLVGRDPETTSFIERYRREHHAEPEWRWVRYERIAPALKHAVLASEDVGFFGHHGFDTGEMKKALEDAWDEKELPRGASTITQQTAKNLWLSPSRSPLRKLREALLTRELERTMTKRRILEIYLNVAEFGPGIYGAEAAARHYFGKSAGSLDEEEAAELAAGLSRPSMWHPGASGAGYSRQVARIRARMARTPFLAAKI